MGDAMKYGLYFLLGGLIVSVSTYVGAMGRGFPAAFASTFPAITGMTFILIYLNGGTHNTFSVCETSSLVRPSVDSLCPLHYLHASPLRILARNGRRLTLYMACVGLLKLTL